MKKILFISFLIAGTIPLMSQTNKVDKLQALEQYQSVNQKVTVTAKLKSSSRLFGSKDDLTSVILIIPADSTVTVLDSDSTYLHVVYEENEGFIYKRQAVLDKTPVITQQYIQSQPTVQETQPAQEQQQSRFSYLENKYGSNLAARLMAGKIWRGMNSEMVKDSWGTAEKINRIISGNIVKEEWIFKNTWLYFEGNSLVEWGPTRK
jgi:hypothetical protein